MGRSEKIRAQLLTARKKETTPSQVSRKNLSTSNCGYTGKKTKKIRERCQKKGNHRWFYLRYLKHW